MFGGAQNLKLEQVGSVRVLCLCLVDYTETVIDLPAAEVEFGPQQVSVDPAGHLFLQYREFPFRRSVAFPVDQLGDQDSAGAVGCRITVADIVDQPVDLRFLVLQILKAEDTTIVEQGTGGVLLLALVQQLQAGSGEALDLEHVSQPEVGFDILRILVDSATELIEQWVGQDWFQPLRQLGQFLERG